MKKLMLASLLAAPLLAGCPPNGAPAGRSESRKAKVERGDIAVYVSATGEIKPVKEVELKSKASGQVVRFKKEPGDTVDEGELIAELDKKTEQRNLAREEANLLSAEARLELTRLEYARSLRQAESELAAATEESQQKKSELGRLEKLTGQVVTESELGTARLAARVAEEKFNQAEASLTLIRGRKQADEKLATADVMKAQVAVEEAKDRLKDTEILSPIKGILLKKSVEEGQIVASGISASTGGTPIAFVADVSKLMVETNVDETDIAKVKKDQPVTVQLTSGAGRPFRGRVDLIPPKGEIDSNVIVFKVRVLLEGNVFGRAYVGMTATVNVFVDEHKNTLIVPSEAVRIERGKRSVQVPDGQGTKQVDVKVGLDDGRRAEILSGLEEGQEVVITVTPEARPGRGPGGRSIRF